MELPIEKKRIDDGLLKGRRYCGYYADVPGGEKYTHRRETFCWVFFAILAIITVTCIFVCIYSLIPIIMDSPIHRHHKNVSLFSRVLSVLCIILPVLTLSLSLYIVFQHCVRCNGMVALSKVLFLIISSCIISAILYTFCKDAIEHYTN